MTRVSNVDTLISRIESYGDRIALVHGCNYTYRNLFDNIVMREEYLRKLGNTLCEYPVMTLAGDFGMYGISSMLAMARMRKVIVPMVRGVSVYERMQRMNIAEAGVQNPEHPLLKSLVETGHPGLILFSSGSTGQPKAALHDLDRLLDRYQVQRPALITVAFLLFDHIGGINTMFHVLSNGGTLVMPEGRTPDSVCAAIESSKAEVLPTSPTFLNLLLMSGVHTRHDLSSLKLITYGTEVMPSATLERLHDAFPNARLKQTYGLSELGIMQTKSRDDNSLWMRVGGKGYETRVKDGTLWIRAETSMLGYLNAPNPFDEEGWFNTNDVVEQDGEWIRILGRESDIINVGGNKVYPADVENVLMRIPGVVDATVYRLRNPITGYVVAARLTMEDANAEYFTVKRVVSEFCEGRLPDYAIPVLIEIVSQVQCTERFKKQRKEANGEPRHSCSPIHV